MARNADLGRCYSDAYSFRINVMFGIYEHVCTLVVSFYVLAMIYGCFMDWYTNR
jgi:hypothetical protein